MRFDLLENALLQLVLRQFHRWDLAMINLRNAKFCTAGLIMGVSLALAAAVSERLAHPPKLDKHARAEELIERLRKPRNKVKVAWCIVPGGEMLHFSAPMQELITLGDDAREALNGHLNDSAIQNEVVVALGAVGDETTVPQLIDLYPETDVKGWSDTSTEPSPERLKIVCFTHALTYLTSESIGRSRWGTNCSPKNKKLWQQWWAKHYKTFFVSVEKPRATWVPGYPSFDRQPTPISPIVQRERAALRDADPEVRRQAIIQLSGLGSVVAETIPDIVASLKDPDSKVRAEAANALDRFGTQAHSAFFALVSALHDYDPEVRSNAARTLARFGEVATPAFLENLTDKDPEIRRLATSALHAISPKQKSLLPVLFRMTKDEDAEVRSSALSSLRYIDPESDDVFQALLTGLDDPSATVRQSSAYDLGTLGSQARKAGGKLLKSVQDSSPGVRREAIEALVKTGALGPNAVPNLIEALRDEDWQIRSSAAEALSKIGPPAKDAVPALRVALRDRQANVRWWSAEALGNIGVPGAFVELVAALKDEEYLVRRFAADALKKTEPKLAAELDVDRRVGSDTDRIKRQEKVK